MEAARSNRGGPRPMEEARTNGGGPYQWGRPVPVEAASTKGGDLSTLIAYVYPFIFATINNYMWSITKADGLLLVYY
jgi:hypothetical protein